MYIIKILESFSAAHSLRHYKGKCEALHGHNWRIEVMVKSNQLNEIGMVMDFGDLKAITRKVLEELDHHYLNDLEFFQKVNPSSEEISRYIYTKLKERLKDYNCQLESVSVWETDNSCGTYKE